MRRPETVSALSETRPRGQKSRWESFYRVVRRIPAGSVATYGDVAVAAGFPGHARQVGYALHALPDDVRIPWHRVVNARGEISPRARNDSHELQRNLLEAEGVEFDVRGRIPFPRFRWSGGRRERETTPRRSK